MRSKIERRYDHTRSTVIRFHVVKVSDLWEKIHLLTLEVEANDLEFQTMPSFVEEITVLREDSAKL